MITAQQIRAIVPFASKTATELYTPRLNRFMPEFEINNKQRVAAFIAQIAHESGSFRYTEELASGKDYEGSEILGNTQKGDGERFKGRGLIQITGRANYAALSKSLFGNSILLKDPKLLSQPDYAVESACWFWKGRGLNEIADKPDTWTIIVRRDKRTQVVYDKFQYITYRINGGLRGYPDRIQFYNKALAVLNEIDFEGVKN